MYVTYQSVLPSYMKTAAVGFGLNCSSHENLLTRESAEQIVKSSTVFTRAPNQYSRCLAISSDLLNVLPAKTRLKDNNIVKTA